MKLRKIMVCLLLLLGAVSICVASSAYVCPTEPAKTPFSFWPPIEPSLVPDDAYTAYDKYFDEILYRDYPFPDDEESKVEKKRSNVVVDKDKEESGWHKIAADIVEEEMISSNVDKFGVYVEGPYDYTVVVGGEGSDVKASIVDIKSGKVVGSVDVSGVGDTPFEFPESSKVGSAWRYHGPTPNTIKLHDLGKRVADKLKELTK
ncbi:MAG: hypothetical protein KAU03_00130 [Candidatus Altiarchaeales archaeon]|nr:hypothetical protein [Candidatus Altiarchaeales archaeon]